MPKHPGAAVSHLPLNNTVLCAVTQLQEEVRALRSGLARAVKAHDDSVRAYEALLAGGGLPHNQLGLRTSRLGPAPAPARLVQSCA